jgi:transposase-like protein
MPKSYPSEFRARALALVKAGKPVSVVARDLEIAAATLYRWREQELIDSGLKPGVSTVASAELLAARRRIRELETEVEILNRANERFKDVVPPKDRCGLVADLAAEGISVQRSCRVLNVSTAGYYYTNIPASASEVGVVMLARLVRPMAQAMLAGLADRRGARLDYRSRLLHGHRRRNKEKVCPRTQCPV